MKTKIGLPEESIIQTVDYLKQLLANEVVLQIKTKKFHWNVTGPDFPQLHGFFETHYDELSETIDEVAERCRKLGHYAPGSMGTFLRLTTLKENQADKEAPQNMLTELLGDHETIIRSLRPEIAITAEKYDDIGTSDFLTGVLKMHEKMAWMIRSMLE